MSSRWAIDVYEEAPIVGGWLLEQPDKPMGWSPPKEPKVKLNKKPMQVPLEYAQETCKKGGGAQQCRYLSTSHTGCLTCLKNTTFVIKINRGVESIRGPGFPMLPPDDVRRSYPVGDNCEGAQMLDVSIFKNYEANRNPTVILGLTISQFEDTLVECLTKAYEHSNMLIGAQRLRGKNHSPAERLGIFCTSLRSYFSMYSEKLKPEHTRNVLDHLRRTENWDGTLRPKTGGYFNQPNKLFFSDGDWTLNYNKMQELSQVAQTGYRFVPEETQVQSECTASLLLVEQSIPMLNALAEQARSINLESDRVIANMVSIAESLER